MRINLISNIFSACAVALLSSVVFAQSANDVDVAVSITPALGAGVIVTGSFSPSSGIQDGRIFRDGIPSVCPSKIYPGDFNLGTGHRFEEFQLFNSSASAVCATIEFNPETPAAGTACGANAHVSAYIGEYDPANQAVGFVGDVGSSATRPFLFEVPANSMVTLVVTTTDAANPEQDRNFEFAFDPDELSLDATVLLPPPAAVPALSTLSMVLIGLGMLFVGFMVVRRKA